MTFQHSQSGLENNYLYNGNEVQLEIPNVADFNARFYDNSLGRFMMVDPLADHPNQMDQSPYQFGWNNPINLNDPAGECPFCPIVPWLSTMVGLGESHPLGTVGAIGEYLFDASPAGKFKGGMEKMVQGTVNKADRALNYYQNPGQIYENALETGDPNLVQSSIQEENLMDNLTIASGILDGTVATAEMTMFALGPITSVESIAAGELSEGGFSTLSKTIGSGVPEYGSAFEIGSQRLTNSQMAELTNRYGIEFAQVYKAGAGKNGGGGTYFLYSGSVNRVRVPVEANTFLINHTHPGGTLYASPMDMQLLRNMQAAGNPQKVSSIVMGGENTGQAIEFTISMSNRNR